MLLELNIKDFAIIDTLHLRLHRLFNVLTGETGAGKSIIIDAVNTLLGGKIGADFVRAGCERATVEGVFSIDTLPAIDDQWQSFDTATDNSTNGSRTIFEAFEQAELQAAQRLQSDAASADAKVALATLLHEYDITPEDGQLILSRDIFRSGRTVARINGRAFSQQVLQQVASWLIDIHGQSEHMSLLRPEQHINFLDRYAELLPLRNQLSTKVTAWRNARKTLQELQRHERDQTRRAEFLRFEIDEIMKAHLQPGEVEELEQERKVLSNAERLRELCNFVYGVLKGSDIGSDDFKPALDQLRTALRSLNELARLDKTLKEYEESLSEAIYRLEDVAASISSYESDIEDDPRRLTDIEDRLDQIHKLQRKYGSTIEDILQRAAEDQAELDTITHRDEYILQLQQQDSQFRHEIGTLAHNPGEPFKPLTRIASGGETSRLMLALKTILASADATPTLIFDEIDAGISGRSGQIVGEKLWILTLNHQVLCVTHLPQIAAFADTHYNVNKQLHEDRTITLVHELRPEQRVRELAQIMGGNATESSMKSAEELLARSYLWKENWTREVRE